MSTNLLFYAAFIVQVFAVSYLKLRVALRNIKWVFANCPQTEYPKLYSRPKSEYLGMLKTFRFIQACLILSGFLVLVLLKHLSISDKYYHVVTTFYFFLQAIPFILIDLALKNEFKLMATLESSHSRSASLSPRSVLDYLPPNLTKLSVVVYLLFVVFVGIVNQYGFSWFGGWVNVFIISMMNLFFAALIHRIVYSKKINPYETEEDRMFEIGQSVRSLLVVSIAATLFSVLSIIISLAELHTLKPVAFSAYFTLLGLISFRSYRFDHLDLSPYKSNQLEASH